MEFRDALKLFRSERGLAQADIAAALHINIATVARWEQGKTVPSRSFAMALLDYARSKSTADICCAYLETALNNAKKQKLFGGRNSLFTVEHATMSQLIEDAAFPIYVCDWYTDEILYVNRVLARKLAKGLEELAGRKCYACIMGRKAPCEFCHKSELAEGGFEACGTACTFSGAAYRVQGKLVQWNGRRAQVRYLLEQSLSNEPALIAAENDAGAGTAVSEAVYDVSAGKIVPLSIDNEFEATRLKTIFENINGGVSVVLYKDDGTISESYANDRYYQLFGYTKEQFMAELKDPHDTVHPDDWHRTAVAMTNVKKTRQGATFRYRIIKRDRSIAHMRCSSSVTSIEGVNGFVLISILIDITESVQTEQQAMVYGQRLDAIMNNMNSAVTASIIKSDGTVEFLFSNDLYYKLLGYTKEQYLTEMHDPCRCIHPDDLESVQGVVFGLRCMGDARELQYRIVTRDRQTKWIRAHISLMTFPDADEPVQLAVYSDVTDIVEARRKIDAQHDQIAGLLNGTPSGIAIIETNPADIAGTMRTTYYNDRFIAFSGYDRAEYDAIIRDNEMSLVFDEDVPVLTRDIGALCSGETGVSIDSIVRCHTKDGGFRWLLLTGQLAERRGDICVINIAMLDVTERQEAVDRQRISDEMLRIAAETDQRAVIIYDVKNNTCRVESRLLYSAAYGETFGDVPQSLLASNIVAQDSAAELGALFGRIRSGERKLRIALQMRNGPGKYEWFECSATTVFDAAGLPNHAVLVFHNIMEQRMKEAVFRKWQQSIESRAPESYALFRCNLSRDANFDGQYGSLLKVSFPLEAIPFNSRTKLYAEECVFPDDREACIRILDSDLLLAMFYRGERFASLDFRETTENGEAVWRRLTVETVEYPDSTDVQAFILFEDIDEDKKSEIAAKERAESDPLTGALNRDAFAEKVEGTLHGNAGSPCALIMLDTDGFRQLNDTFGHAAGDQALQEVVAVLRSCARTGDLVCRLADNAFLIWLRDVPYDAVIGRIAQQMCDHIRKAYSQEVLISASAGIAVYPRDGQSYVELHHNANLALCKGKRAGMSVCAFSGTTGEAQTDDILQALVTVKPSPQPTRSMMRRMLIVDDSKINRITLKNIFKDEYLIETAKNGEEALLSLRHFGASVSVVLLDLLMPGVDGFTVLRRMRDDDVLRTIPAIVVTGDVERSTLLRAFEAGAAEYVAKPVDVDIIRMRVKAVISKAENEHLRAQNSYLMLQRNEEIKYRTVLESTGTVVVEYDRHNQVYIYDAGISKHIAGNFDHRGLWQIFLSDNVAESDDVKSLQDMLIRLDGSRDRDRDSKLVMLKTAEGVRHWFRVHFYKNADDTGIAEKMIITFNDVHDEVLANDRLRFQATRDELTGLYNRAGFLEKAAELINAGAPGYYVMSCIDVEKFQVINDRYGPEIGDEVLKHIAASVNGFVERNNGICCRYTADRFAVLFPAKLLGTEELAANHRVASRPDCIPRPLRLRIGRCMVNETSLSVSAMFDRATMAEAMAKGQYNTYIVDYDESMRDNILREQQIAFDMVDALRKGEFEPWFQPQYNHATGALIGAEALVRWRKDGKIIAPGDFIPVLEKNGFIYEVDQSIWQQVCTILRRWLDEGKQPLPVSVNISRYDMLQENCVSVLTDMITEFRLPVELLRLEITESAFSADTAAITDIAGQLIAAGFTVEIDDFGSGYSSLNTLKDVPASILKLDMHFFEKTGHAKRGGNIVESVVRMTKWLGMAVIAEGVEDKAQADYLKSIGCVYIQGYYYAKPMPIEEYEKRLAVSAKESKLTHLRTLQNLDNNEFWDSRSMDTLIFNSYVGSACILELCNGKVEMLRATDQYVQMLCGNAIDINDVLAIDWTAHMDSRSIRLFTDAVTESLDTRETVTGEFEFRDLPGCPETSIIRSNLRVIATAGEHILIYCLSENMTDRRIAERTAFNASERINAVMDHSHCGISAVIARPDGSVELIFVNNRFFELLGYTREQYTEEVKSPYDRIVPEERDRVVSTITQLREIGSTVSMEVREMRRDGSIVWLRCDVSLVRFADIPEPVQIGSFLDITRQKENELKQLESAHKLEVIMSNVNGGVSALQIADDATSTVVFNNDRYYELYGYTREEALAQNLDVMSLILPEDLPGVMAKVKQMKSDRRPCIIDYRITKKDGGYAMLRVNASLMSVSGYGDDVIAAVVTDITERKSLEERLGAIIANINGGVSAVYLKKDKPEYALANEQYFRILGYSREEFEAENINPFDLLHPDDCERVTKRFTEMHKLGERYTMEYRIIRRDGAVRHILCNTNVIKLFGVDEPLQLAVANDITELREVQRKEKAVNDRLGAVMNAMSEGMAAVAVHGDRIEFLFANSRYYELHGLCRGEGGGDHLSDAIDQIVAEYRCRLLNAFREAIRTERTVCVEYQIRRPDETTRWVQATISAVKLMDIAAPAEVAVFSDITDKKEATDQLSFLNDTARDILTQSDSEQAIRDTLTKLMHYLSADRGYVIELDESRMLLTNTYEVCAAGVSPEKENWTSLPYTTSDYWYETLSRNEYFVMDDSNTVDDSQSELREMLRSQGIRSIILAPLWRDGHLFAFAGVDNPAHTVHLLDQLKALADYCTALLTRRDLIRKIKHDSESVRQLLDDTPGGFVRLELFDDRNPIISTVNIGICKMLGMTKEELMETYGDDVFACLADDAAGAADKLRKAYVSGGQYISTCRLRRKSGGMFWVTLYGRFVHGESGKLYLNAYFTDITQRRNIEQLQITLLDNLPFGAAMYEYDGKTLTAIHINKRYSEIVDRKVDTTLAGYAPKDAIHPDDREHVFDEIRSAIAEERNATCDIRLLCGENEYRLFHLDATIVPGADGKYVLNVAYERITDQERELQETSERLKLLSDSIPGGIATFRCMPGSIEPIFYNDGICTLTGYSREEFNHSSVSVLDLIFEEDMPLITKQIQLLISGETALEYSARIHTKDGGYKWVECMANVIGREGEDVFLISAVLTDVTAQQEERERLRVSEELNRLAIDQSGNIITRYDVAARTLTLPYTLPDIFGLPKTIENMPEEQVRLGQISPGTADAYCSVFRRIDSGEASGEAVYQQRSTLGWRWLRSQFTTVFASDGKPVSAVITLEDITEQREKEVIYARWQTAMAERDLDSYTLVRCNLNKSGIPDSRDGTLLRIDFDGPALSFDARTAEYAERFVHPDDKAAFHVFLNNDTMLAEFHRGHRSDSIDYRERNEDGSVRWLRLSVDMAEYPDSNDVEAYLLFENIDEQKHAELSTIRRAETDPLTGVLNRVTFAQRVNQVLSRFGPQACHALYMLDIDDFKNVNDQFGHRTGDQVLTGVADILTRFCRKDDLVGRLGGDEFFAFLPNIGSEKVAVKKAGQLCDMARQMLSEDHHISASIGIALSPQDGNSFESLYKAADEALYRAKDAGKDGFSSKYDDL